MSENVAITPGPSGPSEYVWPCWWGGVTRSPTPPIIGDKLRALRLAVGGVAATKQAGGPMFPVRSAKDLAAKLAQALCDLDLVAPVVSQEIQLIETDKIPGNVTGSGKPVFRTLAHVKSTVRIGAADGSFVEMVGSGHGGDVDDKAGGKATTYAWKDAILKGLTTPEKDMIDTDDDSSDTQTRRAEPESSPAGKKVAKGTQPEPAPELPAAAIIAKFSEAKDVAELEALAAKIKSGEYPLAGADRLRATQAFVSRKKELTTPEAT